MDLALNNGKAYINGGIKKTNILIHNGKIIEISEKKFKADREIDCEGLLILPGAIDVHVHFRVPGAEYKEDWFSGSLAALHGGVTTVMDMPNTNPATTTKKALEEKREIAKKTSFVDFDLYMAATNDNLSEIENANLRGVKVYYGSTTGNILFNNKNKMEELFKLAKKKGFVVVVHAEDDDEIKENEKKFANKNDPSIHPKIRTEKAEAKAIEVVLELQKEIGNKLHIAHISSKKGLELVKKAKKRKNGKFVTCEVTPQHLFLNSSAYKKLGNFIKCNPSIKEEKHRKALFAEVKSGAIEIVSTDHAPHSLEEKQQEYWKAPSGVPGVETMLPLLLDAVNTGKLPLKRVMEAVCERPAEIFNWKNKGFIKKGFDADLVLVDMKAVHLLRNEELFTKAKYTPWNGKKLKGAIEATIAGGRVYG
ncbi:MAG TPA: dihydroorotase family protein [archaeon]|nr:dihydroorotase family protein [archaeon]